MHLVIQVFKLSVVKNWIQRSRGTKENQNCKKIDWTKIRAEILMFTFNFVQSKNVKLNFGK